jgi:hypothetical protein
MLYSVLNRRQFSTAPVLGTAQVLVIEVFLLFQPKASAGAELLKRAYWLKLFKQLFGKLPFVAQASNISIQVPIDKPTTVSAGPSLEPLNGVILRYRVTIKDSKEFFRFYQDGRLLISAKDLQSAIAESNHELPFGGELKLVFLASHFKAVKVVIKLDPVSDGDDS